MNTYGQLERANPDRAASRSREGAESQSPSRLVDSRPNTTAQSKLGASLNQSAVVSSQLQLQQTFNQSPRVIAQAKLSQTLSERRSVQPSLQTIQRQEALEEQKPGILPDEVSKQNLEALKEEQPLQGKFETAQKDARPEAQEEELLQRRSEPVQKQESRTGLPAQLKTNLETLSGLPMDDVEVKYNSSAPGQVSALATTQGKSIHLGPGQEKHLAHEAWHVVQQKQGRVKPTIQMKGMAVNDDPALEDEVDEMGKRLEGYGVTQYAGHNSPGLGPTSAVLQAKWIVDKRSPFLIWDRQLDGLRWYYLINEDTYFFIIEEVDLKSTELSKLEGPEHARPMSQWMKEGFVEGDWEESDREIVPFEASETEKLKLANTKQEITRLDLEKEAFAFYKGGEVGSEEALFPEFKKYLLLLQEVVMPAIEGSIKKLPPKGILDRISEIWVMLMQYKIPEKNQRIILIKKEWQQAMDKLVEILKEGIITMLKGIRETYGETIYLESLNASMNLMKRFLTPSSDSFKTHSLVKAFEVFNQLAQRTEQLRFRTQEPVKVNYNEPEFDSPKKQMEILTTIQLGTLMHNVEVDFDVLARRTGANKESSIKHVHEVDLAFVKVFVGVTEAYANPLESGSGLSFQGGGGVGEKVFAVGHKGAIDFRKDVKKTEERFYALIFPKGFVQYFGFDLKKLGGKGASAREPNEQEFSKHVMPKRDKDPEIIIPGNKMFFIRAEKSTPELGQVDIHFGWRDMIVNMKQINYADFFRRYALAVVEFTKGGTIIKIQLLKELK